MHNELYRFSFHSLIPNISPLRHYEEIFNLYIHFAYDYTCRG